MLLCNIHVVRCYNRPLSEVGHVKYMVYFVLNWFATFVYSLVHLMSLMSLTGCTSLASPLLLSRITKTYLYNFDPLKPYFYIVKLGFTEVYIIFHISAQKTEIMGTR